MQNHQFVTGFASGWLLAAEARHPNGTAGRLVARAVRGILLSRPGAGFATLAFAGAPTHTRAEDASSPPTLVSSQITKHRAIKYLTAR